MSNSKPRKLYHYTKAQTAIEYILPNCTLRMNPSHNMNDPIEALSIFPFKKENIPSILDLKYPFNQEHYAFREYQETKILSFSINDYSKPIKGCELPRMWAQYASNFSGICIEIDYEKFIEQNYEIINKKQIRDDYVRYCDITSKSSKSDYVGYTKGEKIIRKSVDQKFNELKTNKEYLEKRFFTKNKDWKNENEYRFLCFTKQDNFVDLSIKDSILKVYVSVNFSIKELSKIKTLVDSNKLFCLLPDDQGLLKNKTSISF